MGQDVNIYLEQDFVELYDIGFKHKGMGCSALFALATLTFAEVHGSNMNCKTIFAIRITGESF